MDCNVLDTQTKEWQALLSFDEDSWRGVRKRRRSRDGFGADNDVKRNCSAGRRWSATVSPGAVGWMVRYGLEALQGGIWGSGEPAIECEPGGVASPGMAAGGVG